MSTRERRMLMAHVRHERSFQEVAAALSSALEADVLDLETSGDPAVRLEHCVRSGGFRTSVTVYLDPSRVALTSDEELARLLARTLSDDVVSPWPRQPDLWLLVKAGGARFIAKEIPSESEDDMLVIDESPAALKPVD